MSTSSATRFVLLSNIRLGIRLGLTVAIGFSLIAVALSAAGTQDVFGAIHRTMVGGVATYCIIGLVLGILGGALRPVFQSTIGLTTVSALLGMLSYLLFKLSDPTRPAWGLSSDAFGAAIFGCIGVMIAVGSRARLRASARARGERET